MLRAEIITLAYSGWPFSVVNATKKYEKPHFRVDYHNLNVWRRADRFLQCKIQDMFEYLFGAAFFTILDLLSEKMADPVRRGLQEGNNFSL